MKSVATLNHRIVYNSIVNAQGAYLRGAPFEEVCQTLLDKFLKFSGSPDGFVVESDRQIGGMPPAQNVVAHSSTDWVNSVWSSIPAAWAQLHVDNDCKKIPELRCYLQYPIVLGDQVAGSILLANRPDGYDIDLKAELEKALHCFQDLFQAHRRHQRQEQLFNSMQNQEALLRFAIDGTTEGMWDWNPITDETYFSDSWLAHLGWTQETFQEAGGREILVHPGDRERFERAMQDHLQGKTLRFEMEYRLRTAQRSYIPVLGRAKVVHRDLEGRALRVVGTTFDLSVLKKTEEELNEAQRSMVETAKFSALGVMAAGIAHEINNPLAIIQAYSEVLENFSKLTPEKVDRARNSILRSVERISKIIRGLRKVARDAEGDPFETVTLKSITDELMGFSQESILHRGVALKIEIDEAISLHCQPVQLSQVFMNLLANSVDALDKSTEKWVRIKAEADGGLARITITDSGPGVPPELANKIFEPFFTTKGIGKGAGLGLSISRSIIEDHGGRFYLQSIANPTVFLIELPLAAANVAQSA